ncbi:hypothetical protein [Streptomyces sp. NBC_01506]|uniref:hypothetical protein n=1 Tax=Streptomyces sp. NBC_01506 TaxID=2903887 RepID=UPI00386C327B
MRQSQEQTVQAVNGFAYGCIGADIHVFGDGVPLYVLQQWRPEERPDPSWLLDLPSRMLNARYEVVGFTGREDALSDLRRWRDGGPRLAIRWLHAPGGQGKSRLAARFAQESTAADWTVATAARGPGVTHPPPGSQDLRTDTRAGVLLVVDYADRWPLAHLTWLLSNALLHRVTDQARVLLLARGRDAWPAVRASVADLRADVSTYALPPLSDEGGGGEGERHGMFVAARDAFADLYGMPAYDIRPPGELSGPDFGLTLAVHLAALAAVDRHAHSAPATVAPDMTGLTAYLLDRERRHWRTLHDAGSLSSTTTEISRAAFVAALTGSLPYREAKGALEKAGLGADADRLLTDHAYCYPPGASDTVLEPLYPDRLAEDFLALSLPGHELVDHTADPWAAGLPELLLPVPPTDADRDGDADGAGALPSYAPRTLAFLTAASHRWPHVLPTLNALDARLPDDIGESDELATAAADLTERLAPSRLSAFGHPAEHALIHLKLGRRLNQARRYEKAAPAFADAVRLLRGLAASDPLDFESLFAETSFELATALATAELDTPATRDPSAHLAADTARLDQAAVAFREAIDVFRRLAAENPTEHQEKLVTALSTAAFLVPRLGPSYATVDAALEAVGLMRRMAEADPGEWAHELPHVLMTSAMTLTGQHPGQARALADEAVGIARRLATESPDERVPDLVFTLSSQGAVLLRLERAEEALDVLSEAAELNRRNLEAGEDTDPWFEVVNRAISLVWVQERGTGTGTGRGAAVRMLSRLAHGDTSGRASALLRSLTTLRNSLDAPDGEDALSLTRDIVHLLRTSDEISYAGDDGRLGRSAINSELIEGSVLLAKAGRWGEAVAHVNEAARATLAHGTGPLNASVESVLTMVTAELAGLDPSVDGDPYVLMANFQAVRFLERIAEAYRRVMRDDPPAHELGLAFTTRILSQSLWELGRRQESVDAGQESVRVWRRCAARNDDDSAEHHFQLGLALRYLAAKLTGTGQAEEAATAAREAAMLWRALAAESPSHYRGVATALYLVAGNLRRLRPAEALTAAGESAALLARFPSDDAAEQRQTVATVNELLALIRADLRE